METSAAPPQIIRRAGGDSVFPSRQSAQACGASTQSLIGKDKHASIIFSPRLNTTFVGAAAAVGMGPCSGQRRARRATCPCSLVKTFRLGLILLAAGATEQQARLLVLAHKTPVPVAGPPWSGGNPPETATCRLSSQPACLTCPAGVCSSCAYSLGNARFVLNNQLGRCECPPGYGMIPAGTNAGLCRAFHIPWAPASDVQAESAAAVSAAAVPHQSSDSSSRSSSGSSSSDSRSGKGIDAGGRLDSSEAAAAAAAAPANVPHDAAAGGHRQLLQVPSWATQCLPCPPNWYSPGGQIGIAQCRPCTLGYGTGGVCASPNCLIPQTCNAGKAPNLRTGTCRLCPYGTFQPYNGYSGNCLPCPDGFTTQRTGAVSEDECFVPICPPGTELDDSFLWCNNCTGLTYSLGGVRDNGAWQPPCTECPYPSVPNLDRTTCYEDICPPADVFSISCSSTSVPVCGPNASPVYLPAYCHVLPRGTKVTWFRGNIDDSSTPNMSNPVVPPVARCPAAADGSNVFYPFITSFRGRSDCFCVDGATNCNFNGTDDETIDPVGWSHDTTATDLTNQRVVVPDPQLTSLRAVLAAMDPNRGALNGTNDNIFAGGGYCATGRFNYGSTVVINCASPGSIVTELMVYGLGTTFPTGTLPSVNAFANLPNLRVFGCDACTSLKGSYPQDWGLVNTLINLQKLNFSAPNTITGSLPDAWGNLVNLRSMVLASSNRTGAFSGGVPGRWGNLNQLQFVDMAQLPLSNGTCMPSTWRTVNGLRPNVTLLYPSNMVFTNPLTAPFCS